MAQQCEAPEVVYDMKRKVDVLREKLEVIMSTPSPGFQKYTGNRNMTTNVYCFYWMNIKILTYVSYMVSMQRHGNDSAIVPI